MLEWLLQLDQALFQLINQDGHTPFLDWLMPWWREKTTWIPLYLLLTILVFRQFGWRNGLILLVGLAFCVATADTMSSAVIKPAIERLRPCNDPQLKEQVLLLVHCGSGYSFTSSHATNHFAVALFLVLSLGRKLRWIRWPLLLWAGSIAYGQVYVGVHYPLDIFLAPFLVASLVGYGLKFLTSHKKREEMHD